MPRCVTIFGLFASLWLGACGQDAAASETAPDAGPKSAAQGGSSGTGVRAGAGGAQAGSAGAGRRGGVSCTLREREAVQCGGQVCPASAEFEKDPCFIPCCVTYRGAERCGFRGTSTAFSTECVLPAVADPSCDEVPQFQGCCEPTKGVCGIVGGFSPGCTIKSNFVTLPANPKACGVADGQDAGSTDAG